MNDKVSAFFQNKSPIQAPTPPPTPHKMTSTTQKLLNQLIFEFNTFSKSVNEHLNTIDTKLKTQSQDIAELKELIIKKQIRKPRTTTTKQTLLELLADKPPPVPDLTISQVLKNINIAEEDLNIVYNENIIFAVTKIIEKNVTPAHIFVPHTKPYSICIFENTETISKWKIATQDELLSMFKTMQNKFRILYLQSMTKRNTNNIFSAAAASPTTDDDDNASTDTEPHTDDILKKEQELNTDFVKMSKINGYKLKDDKIIAEFKKQLLQMYILEA